MPLPSIKLRLTIAPLPPLVCVTLGDGEASRALDHEAARYVHHATGSISVAGHFESCLWWLDRAGLPHFRSFAKAAQISQ